MTYDVCGAGASDVPAGKPAYVVERLVDDLVAVLDPTVPRGEQAHLVGHDWGSVQLWDAVLAEAEDSRRHGRIASFTSISGPAMEHVSHLIPPAGASSRCCARLLTPGTSRVPAACAA